MQLPISEYLMLARSKAPTVCKAFNVTAKTIYNWAAKGYEVEFDGRTKAPLKVTCKDYVIWEDKDA